MQQIRQLKKSELTELAKFIVQENHFHHTVRTCFEDGFEKERHLLHEEDLSIFNQSYFFVVVDDSKIVGSVKITRWDKCALLPIQQLFNISPDHIIYADRGTVNFWHVGRFAISKSAQSGLALLKKLLTLAIYIICQDDQSALVAECDSKFVRVLNRLGIRTKILAPGIEYLGSETLPIYATRDWLKQFLDKSIYFEEIVCLSTTLTKTALPLGVLRPLNAGKWWFGFPDKKVFFGTYGRCRTFSL